MAEHFLSFGYLLGYTDAVTLFSDVSLKYIYSLLFNYIFHLFGNRIKVRSAQTFSKVAWVSSSTSQLQRTHKRIKMFDQSKNRTIKAKPDGPSMIAFSRSQRFKDRSETENEAPEDKIFFCACSAVWEKLDNKLSLKRLSHQSFKQAGIYTEV